MKHKNQNYSRNFHICPKCYGKIDKASGICTKCGFRESDLDGATNTLAKKAKETFREDEVVLTTKLPPDVSKKKLLLYSIFLGVFGAHYYYVGRNVKGVIYSSCAFLFLILFIFFKDFSYMVENVAIHTLFTMFYIILGIYVVSIFYDVSSIIFNRFKVPVLAPLKKLNEYDRNSLIK